MLNTLGQRTASARKNKKLTQTQLAKSVSKSLHSLQGYEAGNVEPPAKTVMRIAQTLGVRVEWLLTGEGEMRAVAKEGARYQSGGTGALVVKEGPGVSPEEWKLLQALREDPAALEQVRLYLQAKHALGTEAQVAIVVTPKPGV